MITDKQVTSLAVVTAGSMALAFMVYKALAALKGNDDHPKQIEMHRKKRETLLELLQAFDEDSIEKKDLIHVLKGLSDQCAFSSIQDQIRQLGYLPKIVNTLNYPDNDVQCQVALLVNNLSLNVQNQAILKGSISLLIQILCKNVINDSTITLFTAVLCALTNLTTLDDSHGNILPHMPVFCELLSECEIIQIKLQVLKVFTNISTNTKNCENDFELAAMMLRSVEPFIQPLEDERFLLRAVPCCANVLQSIHSRWELGSEPHITTPEFVSQKLNDNLVKLTSHTNGDIHGHASRALKALRSPSATTTENRRSNLDTIDLLDVLKI